MLLSNNKKHILIIAFSNAERDPRVHRQIKFLSNNFKVSVVAFTPSYIENVDFFPVSYFKASSYIQKFRRALSLLFGKGEAYAKRYALEEKQAVLNKHFDLVICNDAEPLPLAFELAKGTPVLFEAHEFYPRQFEQALKWRVFFKKYLTRLCQTYIPRCAGVTTVCQGLAEEYKRVFGVLPLVVRSIPPAQDLAPQLPKADLVRLVHHGGANPARRIELMLELMNLLDERFTLDLMLVGEGQYYEKLRKLALSTPRVSWLEPVPMPEIASRINGYDLGIYILPPANFNSEYALPNKFFEFIQARLGIAIGPSPEMARLVQQYDLGVVAQDFTPQALASKLNALTMEDIMRFKQNAHKAAEELNAEVEMMLFEEYINTLLP